MKRVKQVLTRFATMFLALICVIGMGTPVLADGNEQKNSNVIPTSGSFTISGLDTSEEASGIQVSAYKIISVNVKDGQAGNPFYIWDSEVANWMLNNETYKEKEYVNQVDNINYVSDKFIKEHKVEDESGTEQLEGVSEADATKFYEELAAAIRSSYVSLTPVAPNSNENGSASFESKEIGVYLVVITGGVKTYQPTVVRLVPTYSDTEQWSIVDNSATAKSVNPSITKTVADTNKTVAVGETIDYTLNVTVPDYPINSANRYFTVEDTMQDGISYTANSVSVSYTVQGEDGQPQTRTIYGTEGEATIYTITDVVLNTPAKGFIITFTDDYFAKYGDVRKLTITYNGTVVKEGFTSNQDKLNNNAILTYNSDPYNDNPTLQNNVLKQDSDSVRVYSYRIQINKVDKSGDPLVGAQFQIFTKSQTGISEKPLTFTESNGVYILDSSSNTKDLQVSNVTEADGKKTGGTLLIKGLDVGTYIIKEVKAPEGYVLPEGHLEVTISDANNTESGSQLDGSIDGPVPIAKNDEFILYTGNDTSDKNADGVYITDTGAGPGNNLVFKNTVTIDVLNTSYADSDADFTLPSTGGMGTLIFTVGGLFVMAGAVVLAVVMYKKKNA